jgi:hypothetical protein
MTRPGQPQPAAQAATQASAEAQWRAAQAGPARTRPPEARAAAQAAARIRRAIADGLVAGKERGGGKERRGRQEQRGKNGEQVAVKARLME